MAEEARKTATKMGKPTGKKWKRFERIVAALNFAEIKGGAVTLNEKIAGRQFAITVRNVSRLLGIATASVAAHRQVIGAETV